MYGPGVAVAAQARQPFLQGAIAFVAVAARATDCSIIRVIAPAARAGLQVVPRGATLAKVHRTAAVWAWVRQRLDKSDFGHKSLASPAKSNAVLTSCLPSPIHPRRIQPARWSATR
jgi:hypothetical protein